MPGTLFDTDTSFPRFTGEETDSEKIQKLQDYLYQLAENFRYLMSNLGIENFNATELEELGTTIRKPVLLDIEKKSQKTNEAITKIESNFGRDIDGIKTTVSEVQNGVKANSSSIQQNANAISFVVHSEKNEETGETKFWIDPKCLSLKVVDDENGSQLILTSNGVDLIASGISLNGFVTFTSKNGQTFIDGAHIKTGIIEAGTIIGKVIGSSIVGPDGETVPPTLSGATFESIYDSDSKIRSGNIVFLSTNDPGWEQASIFFDEKQDWTDNTEEAEKRLFILANRGAALKLESILAGVSIVGGTNVYVEAPLIDLKSQNGEINIGSTDKTTEINLYGTVKINGQTIS